MSKSTFAKILSTIDAAMDNESKRLDLDKVLSSNNDLCVETLCLLRITSDYTAGAINIHQAINEICKETYLDSSSALELLLELERDNVTPLNQKRF